MKNFAITLLVFITIFIALFFFGFSGDRIMFSKVNTTIVQETKDLINSELSVGDSSEKIENFFKKYNMSYSYDGKFTHRYKSMIRDVVPGSLHDQSVSISIYTDNNKNFKSLEVHSSFTTW